MSFPLAKGLSLVSRGARHQVRTVPYCTLAGDAPLGTDCAILAIDA